MNTLERWFDKRQKGTRELTDIENVFDRVLNKMFKNMEVEMDFAYPSCEVAESDNEYTLKFDLPGVQKDKVQVEIADNQVTVRAERSQETKQDNKKKYVSEISYGTYFRTFSLPSAIDEKKVSAKFENGVLTMTVPKSETTKGKKIQIQ